MGPTPGKQTDGSPLGIETEFRKASSLERVGFHDIDEGVTHPLHIHPCGFIERDLKREEDDHLLHPPGDQLYPSGPPGPYLGTDIVEDRNSSLMSDFGQSEVEIRKIDQNDEVRSLPIEGLLQAFQRPLEWFGV